MGVSAVSAVSSASEKNLNNKHYDSINGLRSVAALCIIAMHVAFNSDYAIPVLRTSNLLYFFDCFVFLFMIISGFGMCCGYYRKISDGTISVAKFYEKRYAKIWPYFALLVLLDLAMNLSVDSLLEGVADLTLAFSLLPNPDISVIGVGWTLGVIFLFYMMFPFFCFLLKTKKRAWLAFAVTVFYNVAGQVYFLNSDHVVSGFRNRENFAFCAMFFMAGCMLFLYKEKIEVIAHKLRWPLLLVIAAVTVGYVLRPDNTHDSILYLWMLVIFCMWVMYAIGNNGKILNNKLTAFISGISMEIYLCHMVIFRVTEKLHLNYVFGKGWASYIVTTVVVIVGAVVFSVCVKWLFNKLNNFVKQKFKAQ